MILIVDDDPSFLEYANAALGAHTRVCFASDAPHAIGLLDYLGSQVGVALVDLDLPGTSGFDLIHEIRQKYPELPIVAISGVFSEAALLGATEVGADGTLRKPITSDWKLTIDRIRRQRTSAN